jgi:hypothetical protein
MVATPETRVTDAPILIGTSGGAAVSAEERVSQVGSLVALTFPTLFERTSGLMGMVAAASAMPLRVSQSAVLVAVKGRTANPKLRAWTFTLDGHDFYVLRLGDALTLVYDVYSEEWVEWDAFGSPLWPVNLGINWFGGTALAQSYGSTVLIGDDTFGLLWFLDPTRPYDENPDVADLQQQVFFERVVQGQVPMVGREVLPCYACWITTDVGAPAYVGAGVLLEISDDGGASYDDMGTVTVTAGETSPELSWYSLGQIEAPGRLFRITDDGAVARIDSMEMNDPDEK